MRIIPLSVVALLGLGCAGLPAAYADSSSPTRCGSSVPAIDCGPPVASQPRIELVDDESRSLPAFVQDGRRYVLGDAGDRYQIRIVNPTGARIEAVVAVDGLDAVDGKSGNLGKRGYIVPAYGEVVIDGFRTSMSTVAAFRFSSVRDSYAARTGGDRNVGVIGVAFFNERPRPVVRVPRPQLAERRAYPPPPTSPAPAASPPSDDGASAGATSAPRGAARAEKSGSGSVGHAAPAAPEAEQRPGLGTQFGESRQSSVVETTFVRASSVPATIAELRYDDHDGLVSRGIAVDPPPRDTRDAENDLRDRARPFPQSRFAQPPP